MMSRIKKARFLLEHANFGFCEHRKRFLRGQIFFNSLNSIFVFLIPIFLRALINYVLSRTLYLEIQKSALFLISSFTSEQEDLLLRKGDYFTKVLITTEVF